MQRIDAEWPPWLESRSVSKAEGTIGPQPGVVRFLDRRKKRRVRMVQDSQLGILSDAGAGKII